VVGVNNILGIPNQAKKLPAMQKYLSRQRNSLIKRQIAFITLVFPVLIGIGSGCTTQTSSNNNPQPTPSSQASGEKVSATLTLALIPQSTNP
jgi:hypothetical protein